MIFQTLPKQALPYIMIRQSMLAANPDAIREAVALGRNWGITKEWMTHAFMVTAWYTGFEGLYHVNDAVAEIMRDWSE